MKTSETGIRCFFAHAYARHWCSSVSDSSTVLTEHISLCGQIWGLEKSRQDFHFGWTRMVTIWKCVLRFSFSCVHGCLLLLSSLLLFTQMLFLLWSLLWSPSHMWISILWRPQRIQGIYSDLKCVCCNFRNIFGWKDSWSQECIFLLPLYPLQKILPTE